MIGQSTPISVPASAIGGFLGGELFRIVAEECGANDFVKRFATVAGHAITSAVTGYAINATLGADVTGAAVTTVQTVGTALIHDTLRHADLYKALEAR
jgi:hypothetical protein